jgi:hypothetical protein
MEGFAEKNGCRVHCRTLISIGSSLHPVLRASAAHGWTDSVYQVSSESRGGGGVHADMIVS